MITRLDLRHFKCFRELKLPLGSLTLLSGVNASGKSSVLHALGLLQQTLLSILDRFAVAFESDGRRSVEGHRLYQDYFTGDRGWFSDSSDTEKSNFGRDMHFRHPDKPGETIPCYWHGKVNQLTLRIHFSWPVRAGEPLYVMYIGQKITRR